MATVQTEKINKLPDGLTIIKDVPEGLVLMAEPKEKTFTENLFRPFQAQAFKTAESFSQGVSVFSENLDTISRYIEEKTGLSRGGIFDKSAEIWKGNAEYWNSRAAEVGVNVVDEIVGEATGGAIPGISEFLLNVPYAAALGAAKAKEGESELKGAVVAATKRALLGKILHQASVLKQPIRAGSMGTTFAAQAVGEGGDLKDITKSFVIGSLYSVGGKGQLGLKEITAGLRAKPNIEGVKVMELIKQRTVDIEKAFLDSEYFIVTEVERNLTSKEREALPFLRQGIKDYEILKKINKEELVPIIEIRPSNYRKPLQRSANITMKHMRF